MPTHYGVRAWPPVRLGPSSAARPSTPASAGRLSSNVGHPSSSRCPARRASAFGVNRTSSKRLRRLALRKHRGRAGQVPERLPRFSGATAIKVQSPELRATAPALRRSGAPALRRSGAPEVQSLGSSVPVSKLRNKLKLATSALFVGASAPAGLRSRLPSRHVDLESPFKTAQSAAVPASLSATPRTAA